MPVKAGAGLYREDHITQRVVTVTEARSGLELRDELTHVPSVIAKATGLPDEPSAPEPIGTLCRLATAMSELPTVSPATDHPSAPEDPPEY